MIEFTHFVRSAFLCRVQTHNVLANQDSTPNLGFFFQILILFVIGKNWLLLPAVR